MNSKEIFEEYTKATSKTRFTKDTAARLGAKESDIICELLKSGYKFEELKRANKGTYNAGMNKFKKWQENGSPADEDADALAQYTEPEALQAEEEKPEYEYPATDEGEPEEKEAGEDLLQIQDRTIAELKYRNDKLEVKLKSLTSENVELKAENSKLEKDIEIQNGHIKTLENRLIGSQAYVDVCEENEQLKKHIDELEAEKNALCEQLADEMMINEKIRKDAEIDAADLVSERENLTAMYHENELLKKRLERAKRYILNTIYEQFEGGGKE